MEKRRCPICFNNLSIFLFKQDYEGFGSHNIVSCRKCGFVYVNNTKDQKYYKSYYTVNSKYEVTRDFNLHINSCEIICKFANKNDEILDIGCSTGHLLSLLKGNGYKHLLGIDPAPACKKYSQKEYNIEVKTETISSFSTEIRYDFIILNAVLEHLEDLKNSIQKITELLKDEGKVFICVPNLSRVYKKFDEPFGEFSIEHINFFSTRYLIALMTNYDFLYLESDNDAIYAVLEKSGDLKTCIGKYIEISNKKMVNIKNIIKNAPDSIIVWGAGSLTRRLLLSTDLKSKVIKFIDRDNNLIGKKLNGIDILPSEDLRKFHEPVLISSFRFKDEISNYIKINKFNNRVISF